MGFFVFVFFLYKKECTTTPNKRFGPVTHNSVMQHKWVGVEDKKYLGFF
jgi:hypothetical protein